MTLPVVSNPTCRRISSDSAVFGAIISCPANEVVTSRGFYVGPAATTKDLLTDGIQFRDAVSASGQFFVEATGLEPGTEYVYVGFAQSSSGVAFSSPVSKFTTKNLVAARFAWVLQILFSIQAIAFAIMVALVWVVGYYVYYHKASDPMDFARGLITVLFATGTIAIAFILTAAATTAKDVPFESRFSKGKEILTMLIGIFGTILGFYFGTAATPTVIDPSLTAAPSSIELKQGESTKVQLSFKPGSRKTQGLVHFTVGSGRGLSAAFVPEALSATEAGTVIATVKADADAVSGSSFVQITGSLDGGSALSIRIPATVK